MLRKIAQNRQVLLNDVVLRGGAQSRLFGLAWPGRVRRRRAGQRARSNWLTCSLCFC